MYQYPSYLRLFQDHCEPRGDSCQEAGLLLLVEVVRRLQAVAMEAEREEDVILALLVAATASQGLGFNRAFFLEYREMEGRLTGTFAVGPVTPEEARSVWDHLSRARLDFTTIYQRVKSRFPDHDPRLNAIAKTISVPVDDKENPISLAFSRREAFCVGRSPSCLFQWRKCGLDRVFCKSGFAVAPVVSGTAVLGVVVADNAITGTPVDRYHADALALLSEVAGAWTRHVAGTLKLRERVKELEREKASLLQARSMVIESERQEAVGQMAEQISHHLRNPLSILGGMVRRLDAKVDAPEARAYIDKILEQAQRVEESLNSLFCFSSPPPLNVEMGRVSDVIKKSGETLEPVMRARHISWHLCVKGEEPLVPLDGSRLEEAFVHIFKNGIEAMPQGGIIFVTVTSSGKGIEVQFSDTGMGMVEAYLDRACEPFFSMKNRGLGLGLSIARQIVQAHGGALEVKRNRLGGVTVKVVLDGGGDGG